MTTTSTFSGVNEDAKPSSRVLRPPGGASSNIFGVEPAAAAPKAKPVAASSKPADSGVFQGSTNNSGLSKDAQRTARDGDDSFNHLFGVTASSPVLTQNVEKGTSASQRVKTHDNLFGDTSGGQSPTGGKSHSSHDIIFGDQATPQGGRTTGSYNPITGADYKDLAPNHHALHVKEVPKAQKEQPQLPCSDGEFQAREGKMQNVQTSTRVTNPPGGKTHKLW